MFKDTYRYGFIFMKEFEMDFDQRLTFQELSKFCDMLSSMEAKKKRGLLMSKFFKSCREKMPASDCNQSLYPLMRLLLPYLDKRVYK